MREQRAYHTRAVMHQMQHGTAQVGGTALHGAGPFEMRAPALALIQHLPARSRVEPLGARELNVPFRGYDTRAHTAPPNHPIFMIWHSAPHHTSPRPAARAHVRGGAQRSSRPLHRVRRLAPCAPRRSALLDARVAPPRAYMQYSGRIKHRSSRAPLPQTPRVKLCACAAAARAERCCACSTARRCNARPRDACRAL